MIKFFKHMTFHNIVRNRGKEEGLCVLVHSGMWCRNFTVRDYPFIFRFLEQSVPDYD